MKKYSILLTALLLMFSTCICNAQTINNIYITNTIEKSSGYQNSSNIMCTLNGRICTNGYFMMSTGGTTYSEPQWKRQTLREKRLSQKQESLRNSQIAI